MGMIKYVMIGSGVLFAVVIIIYLILMKNIFHYSFTGLISNRFCFFRELEK